MMSFPSHAHELGRAAAVFAVFVGFTSCTSGGPPSHPSESLPGGITGSDIFSDALPSTDQGAPVHVDPPDEATGPGGAFAPGARVPCGRPEHRGDPSCWEDCSNESDDDGDGKVDCADPDCMDDCNVSSCDAAERCLVEEGCACDLDSDCPSSPQALAACRDTCRKDADCTQTCTDDLGPAAAAQVAAYWTCAAAACGSETAGSCAIGACPQAWANCHLGPGAGTCATMSACALGCDNDGACLDDCASGAGAEAFGGWLAHTSCLQGACATPDPLCEAVAGLAECRTTGLECRPPGGTSSCADAWECILASEATPEAAACLHAAHVSAADALIPTLLCALDACTSAPDGWVCILQAATSGACGAPPPECAPAPAHPQPEPVCPGPECAPPVRARVVYLAELPQPIRIFTPEGLPLSGLKDTGAVTPYYLLSSDTHQLVVGLKGVFQKKYNLTLELPPGATPGDYTFVVSGSGTQESLSVLALKDVSPATKPAGVVYRIAQLAPVGPADVVETSSGTSLGFGVQPGWISPYVHTEAAAPTFDVETPGATLSLTATNAAAQAKGLPLLLALIYRPKADQLQFWMITGYGKSVLLTP